MVLDNGFGIGLVFEDGLDLMVLGMGVFLVLFLSLFLVFDVDISMG